MGRGIVGLCFFASVCACVRTWEDEGCMKSRRRTDGNEDREGAGMTKQKHDLTVSSRSGQRESRPFLLLAAQRPLLFLSLFLSDILKQFLKPLAVWPQSPCCNLSHDASFHAILHSVTPLPQGTQVQAAAHLPKHAEHMVQPAARAQGLFMLKTPNLVQCLLSGTREINLGIQHLPLICCRFGQDTLLFFFHLHLPVQWHHNAKHYYNYYYYIKIIKKIFLRVRNVLIKQEIVIVSSNIYIYIYIYTVGQKSI